MTKLKIFRQNVILYYSYKGQVLRKNTGFKIDKGDVGTVSKTLKKNELPLKYSDLLKPIMELKSAYDNKILFYQMNYKRKPTVKEISNEFNPNLNGEIIPFMEKYYSEKQRQFEGKGYSISSLKDYKSFLNSLIDFETENEFRLKVENLDRKFIRQFVNFLTNPRTPLFYNQYKTKGNLQGRTLRKRLDTFNSFLKWLEMEEEVFTNSVKLVYYINKNFNEIKDRITKPVKNYSLTLKDLNELKSIETINQSEKKAKELFFLACYTSLRFSDVITVNKSHIQENSNGKVYRRLSEKTYKPMEVELRQDCIEILEANNYNLNILSNQKVNENLKKILYRSTHFHQNSNEFFRNDNTPYKLYELITFHTGRRTFISRLLNEFNIPASRLMLRTGHTQISTLNKYIHTDDEPINTELL